MSIGEEIALAFVAQVEESGGGPVFVVDVIVSLLRESVLVEKGYGEVAEEQPFDIAEAEFD